MVVSRRSRLSAVTALSYRGGTKTAHISAGNRPSSVAAAAFLWLRYAIWSCSSRLIPFSLAIFSADWPMLRPVEGSAIAGVSGTRSRRRMPAKAESRAPRLRAFEAATSARAIFLLWRMGTSERLSAPPAIPPSTWPRRICDATSAIAWLADAQARLTVWAGMPGGRPAPEHRFARQVRRLGRRDHLAHHHRPDQGRVHLGALHQLADAGLGQVHRREVAKDRAGLGEGRATARDDGHSSFGHVGSGSYLTRAPLNAANISGRTGPRLTAGGVRNTVPRGHDHVEFNPRACPLRLLLYRQGPGCGRGGRRLEPRPARTFPKALREDSKGFLIFVGPCGPRRCARESHH